MLTRGMIWDGAGGFRLYAVARDTQGNTTTLGAKTVSIVNAAATRPFGNIDTPGQGATVSGLYPVTGWVLTPNAGATIPASGVAVTIDGIILPGVPSISARSDISAGFPAFDTSAAGRGLFVDTTVIPNGVHSIGWLVTDSWGKADGIGSRFFTIANPAPSTRPTTVFSPTSFWYSRLPTSPPVHQNSANLRNELVSLKEYGAPTINTINYASPVYIPDRNAPRFDVAWWDCQNKGIPPSRCATRTVARCSDSGCTPSRPAATTQK